MSEPRKQVLALIRHPVGGIRSYIRYIYGALDRERYAFRFVTVDCPETRMIPDDLKDHDVELILEPEENENRRLLKAFRRTLKTRDIDIVHSHGATAATLSAIGMFGRKMPHVVTLHEPLQPEHFDGKSGRIKRLVLSWLLPRCDFVHVATEDAKQNLIEMIPKFQGRDQVVAIPHGIDTEAFRAKHAGQAEAPPSDEVLFGYFGRFMPEKGFGVLIEAVQLLHEQSPEVKFRVLAVNEGAYIREYKREIAGRGLNDRFEFMGMQPDISPLMARVDAVVMPSFWEAAGLLAMETLVAGRPLIASTCVGLRETIAGSPALGVQPRDARHLAEAMTELIQNRTTHLQTAAAYANEAADRFSSAHSAAKLENVLLRAMGQA